MKPRVANKNMPAARKLRPWPPGVELPIVATSTMEPRLPSIGMAFIRTPLAPSASSISGGDWSTISPVGSSGCSARPPRRVVVLNASPKNDRAGCLPREHRRAARERLLCRGQSSGQRLVGVTGYDEGSTMTQGRVRPHADVLALTVHGPAGALDLVVPAGAAVTDVAREYAAQAGLSAIPLLYSRGGDLLLASYSLSALGVDTGDILIAAAGVRRGSVRVARPGPGAEPPTGGGVAVLWCAVAAPVAALAGWCAIHASPPDRDLAACVLAATALLGLVPTGWAAVPRLLAAPCFLGAAVFAWVWDPAPERLP